MCKPVVVGSGQKGVMQIINFFVFAEEIVLFGSSSLSRKPFSLHSLYRSRAVQSFHIGEYIKCFIYT